MNQIQRLEHWGEAHHPRYLDILRIALGLFFILKGVEFAQNSSTFPALLSRDLPFSGFMLLIMVHYIIFAHVAGGFLLTIGLLTRVACIAQIPVLVGAMVFVNWDMTGHFSNFFLALLMLALVILFFVVGSGPWSLDAAFDNEQKKA